MAKKKKVGTGGGGGGSHAQQIGTVNQGFTDWNNQFNQSYDDTIQYGQNNPFSGSAEQYISGVLGGDSPNRWMDNLYGGLEDVNLDESFAYLRDFLGGAPGEGGNNPGAARNRISNFIGSSQQGGGANVDIHDSSAGEGAFEDTAQWFLDRDARLNPEDDPTLQPYVEALRREGLEGLQGSQNDLAIAALGSNRWGGSHYDATAAAGRDDFEENYLNQLASVYTGSRESALGSMKDILGLANQRDIAEGNIDAQLAAAGMAANASASGSANAYALGQDQNRLQAISMLLGGSQFGLGLKGEMAGLQQQGQMGALEAGIGYGNLGQSGYQNAANFGELGLGALGSLGNNINSYWDSQYSNQRYNQSRSDQQAQQARDQPWIDANRMIQMLQGLGSLSGDYETAPYVPQTPGYTGKQGMDAAMAGLGTGFGEYFDYRKRQK